MMLALMAMFMGTTVMAKVAYAVYENSTNTLTFYFDNDMRSRQGVGRDVKGLKSDGDPWWLGKTIKKVVFTDDFSNAKPKTTLNWFAYQGSLTEIEGIANLNTSNVTNMSRMFMYCTSLEDLDLHTFSTGSVTDMSNMFCKCSGMKSLNINNFDTSSVTDMSNMFDGCCQLETIGFSASSFTTGNVTNMYAMFNNCSSLKTEPKGPASGRKIFPGIINAPHPQAHPKAKAHSEFTPTLLFHSFVILLTPNTSKTPKSCVCEESNPPLPHYFSCVQTYL